MSDRIWYWRIGTAFQLAGDAITQTALRSPEDIHTDLVTLTKSGRLTVRKYFCWDGASVPAILPRPDARVFRAMHRASLYHDALYDLIQQGLLSESDREACDNEFRRICLEDGLPDEEADSAWRAVREFGAAHADPGRAVAALCAP